MINFIVSNFRQLWLNNAQSLFIIEPYVKSVLQQEGVINQYESVQCPPAGKITTQSFEADDAYINRKRDIYIELIAARLNNHFNSNYPYRFWAKILSLGLIRHLTLAHQLFNDCEQYFDAESHHCNILSQTSYIVPYNFEEVRQLLQNSDFGQEQLFSLYIHLFYPHRYQEIDASFELPKKSPTAKRRRTNAKTVLVELLNRLRRLSIKRVAIKLVYNSRNKSTIKLGILGAFFSRPHLEKLILRSGGKIQEIPNDAIQLCHNRAVDIERRKQLFQAEPDFDKFDHFVFHTLNYFFPIALLEDFTANVAAIKTNMAAYTSLNYLVSEAWLSSTAHSLALALMSEQGIKHIYNEHNCLFYPWAGSMTAQSAALVDVFYSLGWHDPEIPNIVKGASLFEFKIPLEKEKTYSTVLFSNVALVKLPQYSSAYSFCGKFVPEYVVYMQQFFDALSTTNKNSIIYRGPTQKHDGLLRYDKNYLLHPHLQHMQAKDTSMHTGREVMARSRLIIVDYLSTTHLESLHMNVPTVILLNPAINLLTEKYQSFFDKLITAGICQIEPLAAAEFIEQIMDDPESWWFDSETQCLKDEFMQENFAKPETAIDFYLHLLQ